MKKRPSSAQRGYGYAHRKERADRLAKAKRRNGGKLPRCYICKRRPAKHLEHVIPLHRGGSNKPKNKKFACSICHGKKTRKEA